MICSKLSTYIETPQQFCEALSFPVSVRYLSQSDAKAIGNEQEDDSFDCFNGRTNIGKKYQKLQRKPVVNEEPNQKFTEDEKIELTDVLDRLSSTLFANNGWVSSIFRNFVSPGLKQIKRFDRRHKWASGLLKAVAFIAFLLCCLQFI